MDNFAPSVKELTGQLYDERSGKKRNHDAAILILTNKTNYFIDEMVGHLRNQTNKDFDIVIVYGPADTKVPEIKDFNVVHIIRSTDVGPSGGFYLAEKYSLEQGYRYFIRAESDAMPVDRELIGALLEKAKGHEVIMPRSYNHEMDLRERGVHRYTLVKREAYLRNGISFFPFYFGGEDLELQMRLKKSCDVIEIDNYVVHPIRTPIVMNSFKHYYFTRNELFARCMYNGFFEFLVFCFKRVFHPYLFMLLTGDPNRKAFSKAVFDFLKGKMWIEAITNVPWSYFESGMQDKIKPELGIIKTNTPQNNDNFFTDMIDLKTKPRKTLYFRRDGTGIINLISGYIKLTKNIFDKNIIVNIMPLYDLIFYSLITKSVSFKDGKNWHYKKFSSLDRAKTGISLVLVPFALSISLLFTVYSMALMKPGIKNIFEKFYKESVS